MRLVVVIAGNVLLAAVLLYLAAGAAVGLRFAITEATAFSGRAAVGSFPFRMLLVFGAALLWPLILRTGAAGVAARPPHGPARGDGCRGQDIAGAGRSEFPATTGEEGADR